ncbi:Phosphopantetheine adenylyltransferase [Koleobacter methoxysyntrophicus]|uniref:Phosphopantetheine adenylyltransferase n=1 Tax=Koleobacter methoxysyntrophicus TaxID=2751313 RepID=A0A8A0RNJ0_9FIRM|nr:pantetheine-phosphate adenylyltransferase [Koleobacter methoxysyntrophicus]MDI3540591.1 pantetheine-phosphate adenylyltransferase [Thermosediminibacterales bacterium]MDK2901387.1 pantetheine-phosphate adenylyltransferase [Thermosediminibacterales bacterium]QSQ09833.1 Phosphopantetheine adenylyltransferase [Koleobacter methoxysyntrophicus]
MIRVIYPGSFDPVTNGHIDIILRCSNIFDHLIIAVLKNPRKNPLFTVEERVILLEEVTKGIKNVSVDSFEGLLVDYAKEKKAAAIVKGLRAISDFESEFQMALMNRKLNSKIETIFMMTNSKYSYISSSLIKEIASFGGCIDEFVPPIVKEKLIEKFKG